MWTDLRSTSKNPRTVLQGVDPQTILIWRPVSQQNPENVSLSWCKSNPWRFWQLLWCNEMRTAWMIGYNKWHLPPKWHLVKSNVYSKAFYHLVTKNFKINMKFLLNRNGKKNKLHKLTGETVTWKSPSMVRFDSYWLLISNETF